MAWTWPYSEEMEKNYPSGMSSRYCRLRLLIVRFCRQTCQRQHLPRAFETACIPLGLDDVSWQKICLWTDLAPVHIAKTPNGSCRIPNFGRLATIFAGLIYLMSFAGESPCYASLKSGRHTSVHRHRIGLARGSTYPQNMRLVLPPPLTIAKKNEVKTE
jgi:hypothetical protein